MYKLYGILFSFITFAFVLLCYFSDTERKKHYFFWSICSLFFYIAGILIMYWQEYAEPYRDMDLDIGIARCIGSSLVHCIFLWVFSLINLIKGIKYHLKEKKIRYAIKMREALEEIETNNLNKTIWAEALVKAKGNHELAQAHYIRLKAKNNKDF